MPTSRPVLGSWPDDPAAWLEVVGEVPLGDGVACSCACVPATPLPCRRPEFCVSRWSPSWRSRRHHRLRAVAERISVLLVAGVLGDRGRGDRGEDQGR
jgi:hypothetical protein